MSLFDSYDDARKDHQKLDPFGIGSLFDRITGTGNSKQYKVSNRGAVGAKIREIMASKYPKTKPSPPQGTQQTSAEDIFARLEALADHSRYMGNPDDLLAQARASADAQYNPLIAKLRQQMGSAQSRGERGKREVGDMYSSLSSSLAGAIPGIQQQFSEVKQETGDEYRELKDSINQQYASSAADQEAMMKRLNIQAAAPDVMAEQQKDQSYFAALADKEGQTQQSAIGQEERGATEYTRRGSDIARFEGAGRQSDIESQLQELLSQLEGQVGAQEAARESAVQSSVGTLSSQMEDRARKFAQDDYTRFLQQIQLGRDLRKDEIALAPKVITKVSSPADVGSRALGMGLPLPSAQKIQSTFLSALGTNPNILAGIDNKFGNALPKEALAYEIVEAGRQAGLSQQEINALQVIALEYFGRA